MTAGIYNRNFFNSFKRLISVQQNVNKYSRNLTSAYHTTHFRNRNDKSSHCFPLLKHSNKTLCCAPSLLQINFQKRNLSNEANGPPNFNSLSQASPDVNATNEALQLFNTQIPSFLKHVSDYKIVQIAQDILLKVHETTGLPWWASIVLTAFVARATVTLPFSIIQARNASRLEMVSKEMEGIVKSLKQEANYAVAVHHWPEELARKKYNIAVKKSYNKLIVRDNCHPARGFILIWVQLPLWFSFSIATRNLCYMLPKQDISAQVTFVEMTVGGFGWVNNLAAADPYMVLPIALALVNLSILEVYQMFRTAPLTRFDRWRSNFFRFISIGMIPIAAVLPAATNIYWLTSSLFGLMQAFLLHSTRLRRLLKMPITKSELEHPYRYFYSKLKTRLRLT